MCHRSASEQRQVLKMHGGPWLEAYCFDGVKRMCHICGKMGRKVRIAVGDIVLISLRGFQVRDAADLRLRAGCDAIRAICFPTAHAGAQPCCM